MKANVSQTIEINRLIDRAHEAYLVYRTTDSRIRARFMHTIADEIENLGDELIDTAHLETNLPHNRLIGEKARTVNQWRSYADALSSVLMVSIDTANPSRIPAKPDIRKTYLGVGVVAVFCASNFPLAFSTLGGDTASAIAAGCAVVVKTHSGHPKTSRLMASVIKAAIKKSQMPAGLFAELTGQGSVVGQQLVNHPHVKSVGFTGSYHAGKILFDLAQQRQDPIPVFAEMGSVNPVFLLPKKLENDTEAVAARYFSSLTLGVGQFCTNPGIMMVPDTKFLARFLNTLRSLVLATPPLPMLNERISEAYRHGKNILTQEHGVSVLGSGATSSLSVHGSTLLATTTASTFLSNPNLEQEIFGPFGLIVKYRDHSELLTIADRLKGQLTATLLADTAELTESTELIEALTSICGRLLLNDFPTGVEVCHAMQHGGPFPASTDSRFTSVGPDAIKRFARPLSYQNWPDSLLPDELKNDNPLKIVRIVNGKMTTRQLQKPS